MGIKSTVNYLFRVIYVTKTNHIYVVNTFIVFDLLDK